VTDQLFLSIWLERRVRANRLRHFEQMLRLFPFSQREQPESVVSIQAIDTTEPALLERSLNGPLDVTDVFATLRDYEGDDVAYQIESWWDLWRYDGDWQLRPTRVSAWCFGPGFDNGSERAGGHQEDLRIDFGLDSHFLPGDEVTENVKLIESNIRSLLRLVHELELSLPVERRRLETESGENFADRLQQVLSAGARIQ